VNQMNWYKKSQFDSGFNKITLDSYIKLLDGLVEKKGKVPDYVRNEIPENIANDPKINELLNNVEVITDELNNKKWYLNGKLHRENGPAIEWQNGDKIWYINGRRHREDGPAVEYDNGDKVWYVNGKRHREGGPAVEYSNGGKVWYVNGKRHRMDGPAVESVDGHKSWWINGNKLTEKEFKEAIYGELV